LTFQKNFPYKNYNFKNGITDKLVKSPEPKTSLKSRYCEKIFPEILAFSEMVSITLKYTLKSLPK
jgi:hypothetical protein